MCFYLPAVNVSDSGIIVCEDIDLKVKNCWQDTKLMCIDDQILMIFWQFIYSAYISALPFFDSKYKKLG